MLDVAAFLMRAARMRTVSASRKSSDGSPSSSSSAATLRARCGRPGGGGVLAAAALVLCICVGALCAGDPDLGLRVIGIGHKLVLGPAALLRAAFARPFCRLAALGLAALRTAVAQAASRVAPPPVPATRRDIFAAAMPTVEARRPPPDEERGSRAWRSCDHSQLLQLRRGAVNGPCEGRCEWSLSSPLNGRLLAARAARVGSRWQRTAATLGCDQSRS